jgi:CheY-like chemotaxis protein
VKILLVEDEALVRMMAADTLTDAGFEVIEAASGEEAIEACKRAPADLLFTDIRLPGRLTGWDVAEHCRAMHPEIPVIYATGYSDLEPRQVAGSRFFRKPYRTEQIVSAVRELLRGRPR